MIEPTVCRGFSEVYGSWKIICISRRSGTISLRGQVGDVPPVELDLAAGGLEQLHDRCARRWTCRSRTRRRGRGSRRPPDVEGDAVDGLDVADVALEQPAAVIGKYFCRSVDARRMSSRTHGVSSRRPVIDAGWSCAALGASAVRSQCRAAAGRCAGVVRGPAAASARTLVGDLRRCAGSRWQRTAWSGLDRQQVGTVGVAPVAGHQLVVGAARPEHAALGQPDQRRRLAGDRLAAARRARRPSAAPSRAGPSV